MAIAARTRECYEVCLPTAPAAASQLAARQCAGRTPGSAGWPFARLDSSFLIAGGTKISWTLWPEFMDPRPHVFQLEVGTTALEKADDWTSVGVPVADVFTAHDPNQRLFGMTQRAEYRVRLETPLGRYYSIPVGRDGTLTPRNRLLAGNIVRSELQRSRLGHGERGYILKRRITGRRCPRCIDQESKEAQDADCLVCLGTGRECGYYYPLACAFADPEGGWQSREHLDQLQARGTINDKVIKARMVLHPLLEDEDIFVNKKTDVRYVVHMNEIVASLAGVPLIGIVELRRLPFTSPIYSLDIPQQLEALGL